MKANGKIYVYFILAISHIANNICLFSRSIEPSTKRRAIYYIEVMELWTIISFTNVCTKKDISLQTHNNTTRYCETLMHHCLFDVFWLQGLCRLCIRYTMVRGHICMLQRNRDIYYYYYDYYFQYNTKLKLHVTQSTRYEFQKNVHVESIWQITKFNISIL